MRRTYHSFIQIVLPYTPSYKLKRILLSDFNPLFPDLSFKIMPLLLVMILHVIILKQIASCAAVADPSLAELCSVRVSKIATDS